MNQTKMEHQQSFERSKKQINSISIFILVIAMLALLAPASDGQLVVRIVRTVLLLIILDQFYKGKKWAGTVIMILSGLSILQVIPGFFQLRGPLHLSLLSGLILSFGYVVWYLATSKEYENYVKLKAAGYGRDEHRPAESLEDIVDPGRTVSFQHKEIRDRPEYLELAGRLLQTAGLDGEQTKATSDEDGENRILVETEEAIYVLEIDQSLNIFDRRFIDRFNNMLAEMGQGERFYYFYPNSIVQPGFETLHLAYVSEEVFERMKKAGFAK
jgi:hypothetical protein